MLSWCRLSPCGVARDDVKNLFVRGGRAELDAFGL
jgi:hypothetical protein